MTGWKYNGLPYSIGRPGKWLLKEVDRQALNIKNKITISLRLHLTTVFPVTWIRQLPLGSSSTTCSKTEPMGIGARYPSSQPTINVKALKGTQSTDSNHWPCLIRSSHTTALVKEWTLFSSCQLSIASTTYERQFYYFYIKNKTAITYKICKKCSATQKLSDYHFLRVVHCQTWHT